MSSNKLFSKGGAILIAVTMSILIGAGAAWAMPPFPGRDIPTVKENFPPTLAEMRAMGANMIPTTGVGKAIVLLVDFSDKIATRSRASFEDMLFTKGTYPTGSMRDYYWEVSYNRLDITGQVSDSLNTWYRAPQSYSYYANGRKGFGDYPKNAQKLVEDVVKIADSYIDFGEFDQDNDGYVDMLFVVHAGPGAEYTGDPNDIWSHAWTTKNKVPTNDVNAAGRRVYVWRYSMEPEDGNIGVFCHELGHVLGLPDLYDIDGSSSGAGAWCLMSFGSWNNGGNNPAHLSAWCKKELGWVIPQRLEKNRKGITIPPVETDSTGVYRLWTNGSAGKEYFLIENRGKIGSDRYLPGEGLLIWHIDEGMDDNDNERHYMVGLMQADGKRHLENGNNDGDSGDPFPGSTGNTNFSLTTNPNSKSYSGKDSSVAVVNISQQGTSISADMRVEGEEEPPPADGGGKKGPPTAILIGLVVLVLLALFL